MYNINVKIFSVDVSKREDKSRVVNLPLKLTPCCFRVILVTITTCNI